MGNETKGVSLSVVHQQLYEDHKLETFPDDLNLVVGNNRSGKRRLLELIARGRKCSVIRENDISPYGRIKCAVRDVIIVEANVIDCLDSSRKEHLAVHLTMLAAEGNRVFAATSDGYVFVYTIDMLVENYICGKVSMSVLNMIDGTMTRHKSIHDVEPFHPLDSQSRLYDLHSDMFYNSNKEGFLTSPALNRFVPVIEQLKTFDINDVWGSTK